MKLNLTHVRYAESALDRMPEFQIHNELEQIFDAEMERVKLFADVPFDVIVVTISLDQWQEGGKKKVENNCRLDKSWRLNSRHREFDAEISFNRDPWLPKQRSKLGLSKFPSKEEMIAGLAPYVRLAIAQVAVKYGAPRGQIELFLNHDPEAVAYIYGEQSAVVTDGPADLQEDGEHEFLELSFDEGGEGLKSAMEKRRKLADLLGAALDSAGLGSVEGVSSGSGEMDIGFKVTDGDRALALVRKTLQQHGYNLDEFRLDWL